MDARVIKSSYECLLKYIPVRLPTTGWYFADTPPDDSVTPESDQWLCMFSNLENVAKGKSICFSEANTGCGGAIFYFGFSTPSATAGAFLAEKEKFKQSVDLGNAFYQEINAQPAKSEYLIFALLSTIKDDIPIEVVNLWVDAVGLSGLTTLANFDRVTNDNVISPFASGCQSLWTIPYKEGMSKNPRAVVGSLDPAMRRFLTSEILSFSLSANRFYEMAENISDSFLIEKGWSALLQD